MWNNKTERENDLFLYLSTKSNTIPIRKGEDEKGKKDEGAKSAEKTRNSRVTVAVRKTNEPTINTRRTIEEAFDLVTPANQSRGRLIPHSSRSPRPSAVDQTMPDSGKLSKRPFRKNSICTQMKATN